MGHVPLVCRSIRAAQASHGVGRVVVSTDDDAIAAAAEAEGAIVIRRPVAIAGDTASSESALLHALDVLEEQGPLEAELVFLQCTLPHHRGPDRCGAKRTERGRLHGSFSVSPWHGFLWQPTGGASTTTPSCHANAVRTWNRLFWKPARFTPWASRPSGAVAAASARPKPVVLEEVGPEIDTPEDLALCRSIAAQKGE